MIQHKIDTEHLNFSPPLFSIGEWLGDGLILGMCWDPDKDIWLYQLEAPEVDGKRWIPESHLERS
jgi:hypothetical protein